MLDTDLLQSIATQLLTRDEVEVGSKKLCVRHTSFSIASVKRPRG